MRLTFFFIFFPHWRTYFNLSSLYIKLLWLNYKRHNNNNYNNIKEKQENQLRYHASNFILFSSSINETQIDVNSA